MKLTQQILKELITYDPETGVFTWKVRDRKFFKCDQSWKTWNARFVNVVCDSLSGNGYIQISVLGVRYSGHRLAVLYMTGSLPKEFVDHINHDKCDNCWLNLREVSKAENMRNLGFLKRNTSGVTGVTWDKNNNKWKPQIKNKNITINLGRFTEKWDAICARKSAEFKYNFHPNHGSIQ